MAERERETGLRSSEKQHGEGDSPECHFGLSVDACHKGSHENLNQQRFG
jgi:hypothetical protein